MFEKTSDVNRRLQQWRDLRHNATSEVEVLEALSQVKIRARYLDYWTRNTWPKAFGIVENGYFCATGIAIVLYQTLGHLKYLNPSDTTWKVISNHVTGKDGAIFISDGYAYNLSPGNKILFVENEDKYIVLQDLKNIEVPII